MLNSKIDVKKVDAETDKTTGNLIEKKFNENIEEKGRILPKKVKRYITESDSLNMSYDFSILNTVNDEDSMFNTHLDDTNQDSMYIPLREDPFLPNDNKFGEDVVDIDNSQEDSVDRVIPVINPSPTTMSNKVKLPDPARYPKDRGRDDSVVIDGTDQLNIEFSPVVSCGVMDMYPF